MIGQTAQRVGKEWVEKTKKATTPYEETRQGGMRAAGLAAGRQAMRQTTTPYVPVGRSGMQAAGLAAGLAVVVRQAGRPSVVRQAGGWVAGLVTGGLEAARQARRPSGRHAAAKRGALEAAERQAGPVGPVALSCPLRTGPSPAAQAAAVGFGPYWVQTAQEGSVHRDAPDPSGQLFGLLSPNTTPYARPHPISRRPWAGDFPGPLST